MHVPQLVSLSHALASGGFLCLRFTCRALNLSYRVKVFHAVWDYLKSLQRFNIRHIFVGGRSMGSRAAAALARQLSEGTEGAVQGVICLSFPLHPPGQTHAHLQRSEDLRALPEHVPVLFVSGTGDNMCDKVISVRCAFNTDSDVTVWSIWIGWSTSGCVLLLQSSMAAEPWNRVNISFPGAVSSVRVTFSSATGTNVAALLVENEKVLKLLRSEILQTEVRVLYELLYILNNSFRGNKTLKGLKQVEQCVNRLKKMKLDVALDELTCLCPNRIQSGLSIKTGNCDVPSQPMLEWLCLKVLGAAQLMSCTLDRCCRAFSLSHQHMKLEEFVILNLVITSMLSRLWVIFRGVLVSLSTLYQQLLEFLREVAKAQPMPFLTDFSLPPDVAQLLSPSHALLLIKTPKPGSHAKEHKETQKEKSSTARVKKPGQKGKVREDLGVAIERGLVHDTDMKPFLEVFRNFQETPNKTDGTLRFKELVGEVTSFTDMAAYLEEQITWCKSQQRKKEKRLLTFLRLKCHKMTSLEAAGYNVQRKLQSLRREALWASSLQGSAPRTFRLSASMRMNPRRRARFHYLRRQLRFSTIKTVVKKIHLRRERRRGRRKCELSASGPTEEEESSGTTHKETPQPIHCEGQDDIDDIFASVGL
ncbi:nucleolus and neural progenitor protein-like [Limanda limanda]|uniref:nucleolus and neural progenitor protein-like n=1 Tax=Limanda limanda TaxID=27771 RepID=UPI0029C97EB2|nr:nucleolus and neural progenitor protein-like [Limanda limanda]